MEGILTDACGMVGVDCAFAVDTRDHVVVGNAIEANEDAMLWMGDEVEAPLEVVLCALVADDVELERTGAVEYNGL